VQNSRVVGVTEASTQNSKEGKVGRQCVAGTKIPVGSLLGDHTRSCGSEAKDGVKTPGS
jgi:hypothetical protein